MIAPKLYLILLHQPTDTLNGYQSLVYPTLNVNRSALLEAFWQPFKVMTRTMAPMGYPSHLPLSVTSTDIRKEWQKYHEIHPSVI